MGYCVSGRGPVLEEAMPFQNNMSKINIEEIQGKDVVRQVNQYTIFPTVFKSYGSGTVTYSDGGEKVYSDSDIQEIRNKIKDHLIKYGAVASYTYVVENDQNKYFNIANVDGKQAYAYFCDDANAIANHQITIVGWDDNFSKDNFDPNKKPIHNGAWIIQNSWGTDWLNGGYYYISYDDILIESNTLGVVNTSDITYDNLYQHDIQGFRVGVTLSDAETELPYTSMYLANVFNKKDSGDKIEKLTDISFMVSQTTHVEVYANVKNDNLNQLVFIKNMGSLETGYYTCHLDTPLEIQGEKFIVALKCSADVVNVPLEINMTSNGLIEESKNDLWNTVTSEAGESYFSSVGSGEWEDLMSVELSEDTTLNNANLCIKAFTKYEEESKTVGVDSVSLNMLSNSVNVGDSFSLTATVLPETATNKNVTWSSDAIQIATVDKGTVKAISPGIAKITVTTEDGSKTATCVVTVKENKPAIVEVTGVTLNKTSHTMKVGETLALTATVLPVTATNKNVTWSSDLTGVATVNSGVVTALSAGTAHVTVTTEDGSRTAVCTVTVEEKEPEIVDPAIIKVTGVTLNKTSHTMKVGETLALTATVLPENATNKNVTWSSDSPEIATVNNGIITAVSAGIANITVKTVNESKTATCHVIVENPEKKENEEIKIQSITLNQRGVTMHIGDIFTLTAVVTPDNATNKEIVWTSTDSSVATVDQNGIVRAIGKGIATITARNDKNDISESSVITVLDAKEDEEKKDDNITIVPEKNPSNSGNISPDPIPQAGLGYTTNMIIIVSVIMILLVGGAVIAFIKLHQNKDIK